MKRWLVFFAVLLALSECSKKPKLLEDGSSCTAHEQCHSGECRDGICRGSPCNCPGASCADCSVGWRCETRDTSWVEKGVEYVTKMNTRYECYAPCGACPLSTACDKASGLCMYVPFWDQPRVDIDLPDAGPYVPEGNVTFHADVHTRPGSSIVSYAWSTSSGATASGPAPVLSIHADTSVTVTVTDDRGKTATDTRTIWPKTR